MFLDVKKWCWEGGFHSPIARLISVFALSGTLTACIFDEGGKPADSTVSQVEDFVVTEATTPDAAVQAENTGEEFKEVKHISIRGGAIKGVIEKGVVRIFSIEDHAGHYSKSPTPLGDAARTDANGQFNVSIPADKVDAVVVEITADSATRMTCDVVSGCGVDPQGQAIDFGQQFPLNSDFILEAAYSGLSQEKALTLYVTPLTHLAVTYASEQVDGLSETGIAEAYSLVESTLNLSAGSLQLPPPDLTKLNEYQTLTGDELQYAIMSASFLAMVNLPDWESVADVINSAANRFAKYGVLPNVNGGVLPEVTLDNLYYHASDIALALQDHVTDEQMIVELIAVESSTDMYYQEVSGIYQEEEAIVQTEANENLPVNQPENPTQDGANEVISIGAEAKDETAAKGDAVTKGETVNKVDTVASTDTKDNNNSALDSTPVIDVPNSSEVIVSGANDNLSTPGAPIPPTPPAPPTVASGSTGDASGALVEEKAPEPIEPLTIVSHPGSIVIDEESSASLYVAVKGGGDIRYQWRKEGVELDGENSPTLALNRVSLSDAGSYDVIVSNGAGQLPSMTANVSVEALTYTARLSWNIPSKRQDGTMLELNDIAGYVVAYGTDPDKLSSSLLVEGAQTTFYPFENLDPTKTYYFKISTLDVNNVQGEFSDIVTKSFM